MVVLVETVEATSAAGSFTLEWPTWLSTGEEVAAAALMPPAPQQDKEQHTTQELYNQVQDFKITWKRDGGAGGDRGGNISGRKLSHLSGQRGCPPEKKWQRRCCDRPP
ncbi:putative Sensor kinase protein [Sesbania bispinosa]|nr:putative Sensor kinase protein [Sesbania bispinosa]